MEALSSAEARLREEAAERLGAIEKLIEQEWASLRRLHEAPVRELREQAQTLTQVSIAATASGIGGLERADARLAQIETSLNERLATISDQLALVVAEVRALSKRQGDAAAWPIEGVVRLHNQLRESADGPAPGPVLLPAMTATTSGEPGAGVTARLDSVERTLAEQEDASRIDSQARVRQSRLVNMAIAGAAVVVLMAAGIGWTLRRDAVAAAERAAAAERQAQAAAVAADRQVAAAREDAARQVAEARAGAERAQAVTDVLAAPDLVRYSVSGAGPNALSGQVLWSRSRGVVFSGVRLPAAPASMTYQLWLLTDGLPVTAGTFAPDAGGRVTFAADAPRIPRPVVGAAITIEPAGGSQVPSERLLVQNRTIRPAIAAP